jgi:hypothetical protein
MKDTEFIGLGPVSWENCFAADNRYSQFQIMHTLRYEIPEDSALIDGAVLVRETGEQTYTIFPTGITTPQRDNFLVKDVKFVNFNERAQALFSCSQCHWYHTGCITTRFTGLSFDNVALKVAWGGPRKDFYYDIDGSLTGIQGATATPYWKHLDFGQCSLDDD